MRGLTARLHRLAGPVDVLLPGARQAGDGGALDPPGDRRDRLEIAVRGDREAGLDDVDAHRVEEIGDLELLLEGHGRAGALLAVAQRGVEDQHAVLGRRRSGCWSVMVVILEELRRSASSWQAPKVWKAVLVTPLSAQACMPGRPSGAAKEKKQTRTGENAHVDGVRAAARPEALDMGGECGHGRSSKPERCSRTAAAQAYVAGAAMTRHGAPVMAGSDPVAGGDDG